MESEEGQAVAGAEYVLHLYITGATPNSARAVQNIKEICERYLAGRYELQIVDIYQQPELAREARIIAAPTLVKRSPGLIRWLVGDLSERRRVLTLLGIEPDPNDPYLHG
ncbi:circadian clock KaiB family protein [Hymenobacter guriensis]|uniref:Circadian clock KaiB family protein n=1 Tax=Hymenobacter guriensis TaxID=2793065 RepID=A0ABS0L3H6_9BACT|nr:circadian clock KaiB family protein [Hymenobacter guriensis]MBG8554671.1 circadian clock KaiB family protein [Hymenobacter guriensis]